MATCCPGIPVEVVSSCQCGFIQERNHWVAPTHLKLWECSCCGCQRNLGFVLPGQTLPHWAVLSWAVPAAQPPQLCSCASPLTWVWCYCSQSQLLTAGFGDRNLGFDILKVTQGSQESTSITGVLDRAFVSRWEVWIWWVQLHLSHLWKKTSLLQWPSSSPQYYWCLVPAIISSPFFSKSLLKITEICVTYLISEQ